MSAARHRISLDLRCDLDDRLANQVAMSGIDRRTLIEAGIEGLLQEFEQIDREEGRPCTCGVLDERGQLRYAWRTDHDPACLFAPAEAAR